MRGALGIINHWRTDAFSRAARLEIEVPVEEMANINASEPVLITNGRDLTPRLLTAADLSPAHLGKRVRVKVLGGAVIEDQLEGVETQWNGGKTLIFLSFKTATFAYSERARAGFPVLPDAEVTIVEEPAK